MHKVNLRSIDLNLLVILDALLEFRHISQAAERLHMSQPAASRAFQRLKDTFEDPLLVRTQQGYDLSIRAQAIRPQLKQLLEGIEHMVAEPEFDPATSKALLRFCGPDLESNAYLPRVFGQCQKQAPGIGFDIMTQPQDTLLALDKGQADFALTGLMPNFNADHFRRMELVKSPRVCIMGKDNPLAKGKITLKRYLQAKHGYVSLTGTGQSFTEQHLEKLGHRRDNVLRLSNFSSVPLFCAQSDVVFLMPEAIINTMLKNTPVICRPCPPELQGEEVSFYLYWHERNHHDPMHRWVRELFRQALNC